MLTKDTLDLLLQHPRLILIYGVAIWFFNNIVTALISSLPAPTKDSSVMYVYWFKVANTVTGNIWRAKNTALENSPNWQAALERHLAQAPTDKASDK